MISTSLKFVGNTPVYQLDNTNIFVKLEKYNLGGSVKDRAVLGMLEEAKRQGKVNEDTIIVEPTSGNTGIAVAILASILGLKAVIIMPESMSLERRTLIKAYGAQLILTPKELGIKGSIELAEKLRGIWENSITEDMKIIKLSYLYDSHGKKRGIEKDDEIELIVPEDELKNLIREKIDKGINNFFIKLEDAFKDEDAKEINIFLAGNSCKHPFVNEIFAEYQEKMKDKIKLNLYDLKAIEGLKEKDSTKVMPTGKTGVAYGLIYSRKGGRIKVTNRDEKENMANEVNFKFYIGNNKRDLFNTVLSPNSKYEKFEYFGKVTSDTFEIYYTTLPEAQTGKMEIDRTNVKRISLNEEYDEDEEYRIYIKAVTPDKISYAIVKKEEDIETKEILEEGEVFLD